jgi:acyl transferase domain-containing protein/NAD(P)H-dependent flavin oxidoreductase YrpB (nitropropane dioxygenase family)
MTALRLVALTPPGLDEPAIAIAACRAGGVGVLDLTYSRDEHTASTALGRLVDFVGSGCGVKLGARIPPRLPREITVVVLTPDDRDRVALQVTALRAPGRELLLEVTSLDEAQYGEELGVDGLIAKGHESGGRIGDETTFILLQRILGRMSLPAWVQGGIGLHTAAACYAAGAAGVVLDAQLFLTRESPLPPSARAAIARMDGSETAVLGTPQALRFRAYHRPGAMAAAELHAFAEFLEQKPDQLNAWREAVETRVGWGSLEHNVWPLGQDAAFAEPLAKRFRTVGGVFDAFRHAIHSHVHTASELRPLDKGAPLARSHNTRYPIVQGPMTRVSDKAAFASAVANGGALPILALALMRAGEVEAVLRETRDAVGDKPWGVGILGFVPLELREEQIEVIRAFAPSFALIAGGHPDQALSLERDGVPTYLHVPSPGLLRLFLENGARRFVFEGRECGGHVGPRSSFVLWETMIETLLDAAPAVDLPACHVLFAGGIHDAVSAEMVAVAAAPLAERGVNIGVLLGTAYLFTKEAVDTGAIVKSFQDIAVTCSQTALLESGPGHSTRCAQSPFVQLFERERRRLAAEGRSADDVREQLEQLNLGRLRIATKGLARHPHPGRDPQETKLVAVEDERQRSDGMYMIGQAAALREATTTIDELHREVAEGSSMRLVGAQEDEPVQSRRLPTARPSAVAIVGMACLFPKAPDLESYWENILDGVDAISEIPAQRWDWQRYFDSDPASPDKIYSRWGGFLDDVSFDPLSYGLPPKALASIEPLQLLTLEVVRAALADAGYTERPFARDQTSVIIGVGGGVADLGHRYALRSGLPMVLDEVPPEILGQLPEWTEDSFPGILLNVAAGRVANRFDLGGVNYTVDAACASSLAAVHLGIRELEAKSSDVAIVGAVDTVQNPFGYLCFSKTHALSPTGRCRPFDASADGIAISEGVAIVVLKRLADAERDGDRIYAVVRSVAGSSDGRAKGLTAPRPEGQALALERAYSLAGFSPATVGLIEAHGTGTVAGDRAEVETLKRVFEAAGASRGGCAIGSVKSMIGHTKSAAGLAGLIKVALALQRKVMPPTINVDEPNGAAQFPESPFYVNSETRPWTHSADHPRRAGVSAFGFGGTNFHAVVEEYGGSFVEEDDAAVRHGWPSELLLWCGATREELLTQIEALDRTLTAGTAPALRDLAHVHWHNARTRSGLRLGIVASSLEDLQAKLPKAAEAMRSAADRIADHGIYFAAEPLARTGRVAFLFPGQGSQSCNMLREYATAFKEVRERFEAADRALREQFPEGLTTYVFPPPRFTAEDRTADERALTRTEVAQPALGVAGMALFGLLRELGVRPAMVAGHSYGEYVALCSAGALEEEELYRLSEARGRCIVEAAVGSDLGTMAAVPAASERVADVIAAVEGAVVANLNAPAQTVISGTHDAVQEAIERLAREGIQARPLVVACAFHSPLVAAAGDRFAEVLRRCEFRPPELDVFSNSTAATYPSETGAMAALLADHLVNPVRFMDEIEGMYTAGARIFVEVGPRNVLTGLTAQILAGRPHTALALDAPGHPSLLQLQRVLAELAVEGVPVDLDRLYKGRAVGTLDLAAIEREPGPAPPAPTTWLVNGGSARPATASAGLPEAQASAGLPEAQAVAPVRLTSAGSHAMQSAGAAPAHVSSATAPTAPTPAGDEVVLQFQRLMDRFLDTQRQVMLAYLGGSSKEGAPIPEQPLVLDPTQLSPEQIAAPQAITAGAGQLIAQEPVAAIEDPSRSLEPVDLLETLVRIACEKTGYPSDMLDPDLDLEAELGIDSIKRVEIVGALQRECLQAVDNLPEATERLTAVKTLRGIIETVAELVADIDTGAQGPAIEHASNPAPHRTEEADEALPREPAVEHAADPVPHPTEFADEALPRFLLEPVEVPAAEGSLDRVRKGVFVVTDDERGIAETLVAHLRAEGALVSLVRAAGADETANLADPTAVTQIVRAVRLEHGPVSAVIHLAPLRERPPPLLALDVAAWRARLADEVMGLFHLVREAAPDLEHAGKAGVGFVLAGTAVDASSVGSPTAAEAFATHGAIAGFVKTLAQEWPTVRCKVLELDVADEPSRLAESVLAELTATDREVEVGYQGSRRFVRRPRRAPLADRTVVSLNSESVVLVTGGARGITAEVACELAERYRPTLVVVGRSPAPDPEEALETVSLTEPQALREVLLRQLRAADGQTKPSDVEAAYGRLTKDREMRRNLASMERAGSGVRYVQIDVSDVEAFGALIDDIYASHGRLDGVVHGAGVIEDRLVEDKTSESFRRVLETKAVSAFVLSRKLRPESLEFLVFFSSVAGCFGNCGQTDYAAANGMLSRLAVVLDRHWPGRVVALNWGPWRTTGMVSESVQKLLEQRGMDLIEPARGRRAFDRELAFGPKGQAEVILGNGPWSRETSPVSMPLETILPTVPSERLYEFSTAPKG